MSNQPPIEVPQGAIRLNTDSQKLEFYAQDRWYEMATEEASGLGGRAFRCAGGTYPEATVIETFNISTQGDAVDAGFDLSQGTNESGSASSRTRALLGGGYTGGGSGQTYIQYFEMNAFANSIDFGDLTVQMGRNAGQSNNTRALFFGSVSKANDVINFVTIASTGNATDFGDTTQNTEGPTGLGNRTRAIMAGGEGPSGRINNIEFVTIATTGNMIDFGDLQEAKTSPMGLSNSTRGIIVAGNTPGANPNTIDLINVATTGNGQDFGDMSRQASQMGGTASNATRGVFFGGYMTSSPNNNNVIDYLTIATTGDSTTFGDLASKGGGGVVGCCDTHGGVI